VSANSRNLAPLRPCSKAGCSTLARARFCSRQAREHSTASRAKSRTVKRSITAWRKLRDQQHAKEPLCRECLSRGEVRSAVEVDHIIPLSRGGAELDEDNIQSLCAECHRAKTMREAAKGRARSRGGDTPKFCCAIVQGTNRVPSTQKCAH
jgi:5-methylcytosine-specific restriction protein A